MKNHVARAKTLGVIRVLFYHLEASEELVEWVGRGSNRTPATDGAVPEKALKGRAVDCHVE